MLKFVLSQDEEGEILRTIAMKIFIGKTDGSDVTALRKRLKSKEQAKIDNITSLYMLK